MNEASCFLSAAAIQMTPYNVTDNNIKLPVNPNNRKSETIGILVASDF